MGREWGGSAEENARKEYEKEVYVIGSGWVGRVYSVHVGGKETGWEWMGIDWHSLSGLSNRC